MGQATPSATGLPLMLSSQASYVIVSGYRAALDLDTYPLSNFIRPRCAERAKRGRGKPVVIMHIGLLACFHAISLDRSRFTPYLSTAVVDRQTYRHTQNDFCMHAEGYSSLNEYMYICTCKCTFCKCNTLHKCLMHTY